MAPYGAQPRWSATDRYRVARDRTGRLRTLRGFLVQWSPLAAVFGKGVWHVPLANAIGVVSFSLWVRQGRMGLVTPAERCVTDDGWHPESDGAPPGTWSAAQGTAFRARMDGRVCRRSAPVLAVPGEPDGDWPPRRERQGHQGPVRSVRRRRRASSAADDAGQGR